MSRQEVRYNLRKVLLIALFLVIIGALTFWLLARESLSEMLHAISGANYAFVGLAICVYIFGTVLWAARWRLALSTIGCKASLRDLHLSVFGSIFINNVTPFTYCGGDPFARVYLSNKASWVPYPSGFAAIAGEFILDLPIFLSLIVLGLLLSMPGASILFILAIAAIWIATAAMLVPLFSRLLRSKVAAGRIGRFIARVLKRLRGSTDKVKVVRTIERFRAEAQTIVGQRKSALCLVIFAAVIWSFQMLRIFLIFLALGHVPPLPLLLLAVTLPSIVGLIPLLPAGLGTVDVALISVFVAFGVPLSLAIGVALIERAITFVLGSMIGACALSYLGVRVWAGKLPRPPRS